METSRNFETDLNAAMMAKGQHPETILVVSLEDANVEFFGKFWANSEIRSLLNEKIIILRLSELVSPDQFRQFLNLFHVNDFPSIVIFGENSAVVTRTFYPFPNSSTLSSYLRSTSSTFQSAESPNPIIHSSEEYHSPSQSSPPVETTHKEKPKEQSSQPPVLKTTTKISIQTPSGRSFTHIFEKTETIATLKKWIETEIGSDAIPSLIIPHTNSPLPENDSLTLEAADLTPSALLKLVGDEPLLEIHVEDGQDDVPGIRGSHRTNIFRNCCGCLPKCKCSCGCCNFRAFKWIRIFFSLLNPWGDDPGERNDDDPNNDNGVWEYRPNPELAEQIRRSINMLRHQADHYPEQFNGA